MRGGFTQQLNGNNLPTAACENGWTFQRTMEITANTPRMGANVTAIIADIERQGYHIADAEIRFDEHTEPW
jgi:hypothetical protein